MRRSFERNLEDYRDIARDAASSEGEEAEALDREAAFRAARAARGRGSDIAAQERIYRIQERKQEIMLRLKERIALLDEGHVPERRPDERFVRQEGDAYVAVGRNGAELPITKGELLTDLDWGQYYYLDPHTVDRNMRKRYLIEDAKQELAKLLDDQIVIDETSSAHTHEWKQAAYAKRQESSGEETGFLAEKMVKGFLKKLSIDSCADFEIEEANAFQDVEQKIDFIIRKKQHHRGVGVEESDRENVGIQFTTNTSAEARERKQRQLERSLRGLGDEEAVDDIVLVSMPATQVREAYEGWLENPQPGGPDKLWTDETKHEVFAQVMQDIMTSEEIDQQWDKAGGTVSPSQD